MKKWEINNVRIGWVALVFSGDRKVVSINPHVSSSAENLSMCCDMIQNFAGDGSWSSKGGFGTGPNSGRTGTTLCGSVGEETTNTTSYLTIR